MNHAGHAGHDAFGNTRGPNSSSGKTNAKALPDSEIYWEVAFDATAAAKEREVAREYADLIARELGGAPATQNQPPETSQTIHIADNKA